MLSFEEMRFLDWYHGKSGRFVTLLFDIMAAASPADMLKISKGFEKEVEVFNKTRNQEGYLDDLLKRYEAVDN